MATAKGHRGYRIFPLFQYPKITPVRQFFLTIYSRIFNYKQPKADDEKFNFSFCLIRIRSV